MKISFNHGCALIFEGKRHGAMVQRRCNRAIERHASEKVFPQKPHRRENKTWVYGAFHAPIPSLPSAEIRAWWRATPGEKKIAPPACHQSSDPPDPEGEQNNSSFRYRHRVSLPV